VPSRPPIEALRGSLDLLVLKTLSLSPTHGWGISQRVQQISGGELEVNQGSLYSALQRLEKDGPITSDWGVTDNNRQAGYYQRSHENEARRSYPFPLPHRFRTSGCSWTTAPCCRRRRGTGEPLFNREARTVQRGGITEEHVREVGAEHERVQLECQLRDVLSCVDLAEVLRLSNNPRQPFKNSRIDHTEMVPDGTRLGVEFGGRGNKKAATGEDRALEIGQEGLAQGENAAQASRCRHARLRHLALKHLGRGIDSRHLQVFLGPKVGEQAALTHSRVFRESGDREPVKTLDGGELSRGVQDGLTAPRPVRPLPAAIQFRIRPAWSRHTNNIARPVVL
jgi:PadR family transcriptional regulator